jgi:hypothetical protein
MKIRWRVVLPIAMVCSAAVWWIGSTASTPPLEPAAPEAAAAPAPVPLAAVPVASGARHGGPFNDAAIAQRKAQLALWQQRLQRSKEVLAAYQASTRYPFDSRPAKEHGDQWQLHQIITNDLPLRMPGTSVTPGMRVHTTQQKVFAAGNDTIEFTVTAVDDNGNLLPLKIVSSVSHGAQASPNGPPVANTAPTPPAPVVMQPFVDDGSSGDAQAGDGIFSAQLNPVAEGFGNYAGMIRTEVTLQSGNTQGYVAFDVVYAPQVPATWAGAVRESLDDGSLDLFLAANVAQAGRYVVTGRVDDADGRPFAFVSFNDELGTGTQQVKLTINGRLVRDQKPAFPLTLHDVDGFLLKPDAYPDRALMPPRDGPVWTTRSYKLALFSDQAFASDETARYVAEYGKDVSQAQQQVDQLQASTGR